ncbi:MAG: hypothetical protein ACK5SI_03035 [Planctomycetia bacterium]
MAFEITAVAVAQSRAGSTLPTHRCVSTVLAASRLLWPFVMVAFVIGFGPGSDMARGQNDWQYPDPYFGANEIEKARSPTAERRYRAEVRQSPAHQTPHQVPRRPRWPPRRYRAPGPVAGTGR